MLCLQRAKVQAFSFMGSLGISVIDTQIWGESVSLRRTLSPQIWSLLRRSLENPFMELAFVLGYGLESE
jgi:hypothetical protein